MWFLSHNIPKRNKLAEKISQKNIEYTLNPHFLLTLAITGSWEPLVFIEEANDWVQYNAAIKWKYLYESMEGPL
jgi:hypothetical protein